MPTPSGFDEPDPNGVTTPAAKASPGQSFDLVSRMPPWVKPEVISSYFVGPIAKSVLRALLSIQDKPRLDLTGPRTCHACVVRDKWTNGVGSTLSHEQY